MDELTPLPLACPDCDARMPETAAFCPGCGRPMQTVPLAQGNVGVLTESVAGALAYFTFIPALVFLRVTPYNVNRFVRFHSFQCLLLWAAAVLTAVILKLCGLVLFMIPLVGPPLVVVITVVASLALLAVWAVLVVKAFQGEMFKFPLIGVFAEHYADPL
jgi:uncharacterized membrane protein